MPLNQALVVFADCRMDPAQECNLSACRFCSSNQRDCVLSGSIVNASYVSIVLLHERCLGSVDSRSTKQVVTVVTCLYVRPHAICYLFSRVFFYILAKLYNALCQVNRAKTSARTWKAAMNACFCSAE